MDGNNTAAVIVVLAGLAFMVAYVIKIAATFIGPPPKFNPPRTREPRWTYTYTETRKEIPDDEK